MIQIYSGSTETIHSYILHTYTTANDIVISGSDEFALPFLLIRNAIPILKKRLGKEAVQTVLEDYKLLTTILYKDENHSSIDQQKYTRVTASLHSNITHSRVAKDTLIRNSSEILSKLLTENQLQLIISDIRQLDTGSIDILRHLYHVSSDIAPAIVIGYNPNWGETIFEEEAAPPPSTLERTLTSEKGGGRRCPQKPSTRNATICILSAARGVDTVSPKKLGRPNMLTQKQIKEDWAYLGMLILPSWAARAMDKKVACSRH